MKNVKVVSVIPKPLPRNVAIHLVFAKTTALRISENLVKMKESAPLYIALVTMLMSNSDIATTSHANQSGAKLKIQVATKIMNAKMVWFAEITFVFLLIAEMRMKLAKEISTARLAQFANTITIWLMIAAKISKIKPVGPIRIVPQDKSVDALIPNRVVWTILSKLICGRILVPINMTN
jgi:hypothetical protein